MNEQPIIIPRKLYVGRRVNKNADSVLPLGFITPADTKGFDKRKKTVDSWANNQYSRTKKLDPLDLDNELLEEYKIAEDIRRTYWGGGNVVWRMIDPRGFEFEISSANLARILDCTTIEKGVIQGKCVFGRQGAHNILLPESSEPYQKALIDTKRANEKVDVKKLSLGDKITLKCGTTGVYHGYYNVIKAKFSSTRETHWARSSLTDTTSYNHVVKRHFIKTNDGFIVKERIHVSEYEKGTTILNVQTAVKHINKWLEKTASSYTFGLYVSDQPISNVKFEIVPVDDDAVQAIHNYIEKGHLMPLYYLFYKQNDVYYPVFRSPDYNSKQNYLFYQKNRKLVVEDLNDAKITILVEQHEYRGLINNYNNDTNRIYHDLDDEMKKLHMIYIIHGNNRQLCN